MGVLLLLVPTGAGAAPQEGTRPDAVSTGEATDAVVARGEGLVVRRSEVIPLLLDRYAMSRDGRDLLKLLVSSRLIDLIARERGIDASEAEIAALWNELDRRARDAGESEGLAAELARRGLGVEEFREYLRLTLLQERLTREALELAEDAEVTVSQQEIWLEQEMRNRALSWPPPPWENGVAARCGSIEVTARSYGEELLDKLNSLDVKETCWHLLLLKSVEKRMPDLAPAARKAAVDAEMERRRKKALAQTQPQAEGVTFEEILVARGSNLEQLRRDPSVHIAALTRLWIDRTKGPEGIRADYVEKRDHYEGLYGTSVHTYLIFLVASQRKNELYPRTFAEAEAELEGLKEKISTLREFAATSAEYSEEPSVRRNRGELGWLRRDDPRYPQEIRAEVFEFIGSGGKIPAAGQMLGPIRLGTGVALLWLSAVRESPPWEEMSEHVHEELRRRFIEEVMPRKAVEMVLK